MAEPVSLCVCKPRFWRSCATCSEGQLSLGEQACSPRAGGRWVSWCQEQHPAGGSQGRGGLPRPFPPAPITLPPLLLVWAKALWRKLLEFLFGCRRWSVLCWGGACAPGVEQGGHRLGRGVSGQIRSGGRVNPSRQSQPCSCLQARRAALLSGWLFVRSLTPNSWRKRVTSQHLLLALGSWAGASEKPTGVVPTHRPFSVPRCLVILGSVALDRVGSSCGTLFHSPCSNGHRGPLADLKASPVMVTARSGRLLTLLWIE